MAASKSKLKKAAFAKGGGPRMLGKGDRTITAESEAAAPQGAGVTGHRTRDRGGKYAEGGKVKVTGGVARPARPGSCGT